MNDILLGAIAGDVIGSYYEFCPANTVDFKLFNGDSSYFTDDTVMTVANADWLLTGDCLLDIMRSYGTDISLLAMAGCSLNGYKKTSQSHTTVSAMALP